MLKKIEQEYEESYNDILKEIDYVLLGVLTHKVEKNDDGSFTIQIKQAKSFNEYLSNFKKDYDEIKDNVDFRLEGYEEDDIRLDYEDFIEDFSSEIGAINIKFVLSYLKSNKNLPNIEYHFSVKGKNYQETLTEKEFKDTISILDLTEEDLPFEEYLDSFADICYNDDTKKANEEIKALCSDSDDKKIDKFFKSTSKNNDYTSTLEKENFEYLFLEASDSLPRGFLGFFKYSFSEDKGKSSVKIERLDSYKDYLYNLKSNLKRYNEYSGFLLDDIDFDFEAIDENEFYSVINSEVMNVYYTLSFLILSNQSDFLVPEDIKLYFNLNNEKYVSDISTSNFEKYFEREIVEGTSVRSYNERMYTIKKNCITDFSESKCLMGGSDYLFQKQ